MKMIGRNRINCVNNHDEMNRMVSSRAWSKMYDALYDEIWNHHIFIFYQIDGALKNNLRGPGIS